jgi:nucleoside-diphosphate-sugar epimerase
MPQTRATVAVTGATGFIGRNLCDRFRRLGWDVRALARGTTAYPFTEPGVRIFSCDLPDILDAGALEGAEAIVHCAYTTRHEDLAEARRVNDEGTRRVLEASRAAGVGRFVFLSSQSAHENALSYYGRSKLALEKLVSLDRDLVFRPGLVLGKGNAGLFHRMCATMRRASVIPLFGGGSQPLQTVHIDDLCAAIVGAVANGMAGRFTVAEPEPIAMRRFLEMLASRMGRRPLFVPFPLTPALGALRVIEAMRLPFPVSSENLLGLKQMSAVDTRADLAALGVTARPARVSLDGIFQSAL